MQVKRHGNRKQTLLKAKYRSRNSETNQWCQKPILTGLHGLKTKHLILIAFCQRLPDCFDNFVRVFRDRVAPSLSCDMFQSNSIWVLKEGTNLL